jgi:hypothetical protein
MFLGFASIHLPLENNVLESKSHPVHPNPIVRQINNTNGRSSPTLTPQSPHPTTLPKTLIQTVLIHRILMNPHLWTLNPQIQEVIYEKQFDIPKKKIVYDLSS